MPRAIDFKQMQLSHDPTRSGTEFHWNQLIKDQAEILKELLQTISDNQTQQFLDFMEELTGIDLSMIKPLVEEMSLDFSSPTAFLTSLVNAIGLLPEVLTVLVATIIEQLASGAMQDKLDELLFALIELLVSLPTLLMDLGNALIESGAGLLGINSGLNALNLFNLVPTDLLSHIPMSNIGDWVTNMLTDPNFLDVAALSDVPGWIHDLTGGFGGVGAMFTTAAGTTRELFGNLIPVSEGQILPISGMAKWSGLLGAGNPIQLAITGYKNGAATLQQTIASHNTTPPTTDWVTLSGTWTVPANVDSIRTRLVVGSTATAGTVGFSNMSVTKTGAMLQHLIRGTNAGEFLPDDIGHLFGGILTNAAALLEKAGLGEFNDLVTTLTGDIQAGFEDVGDRLESFLDDLSPLNGSNINVGEIADEFVPAIGNIFDTTVTNVQNVAGSGFTIESVANALQAQTHALVDAGTGIAGLFGRLSNLESKVAAIPPPTAPANPGTAFGGAIGVTDSDDFERTSSSSLGAGWITSYSGGAGTWATPNGHEAAFIGSGVADRDFLSIRASAAVPRSATDYQRVTTVVSAAATRYYDLLLGTFNYVGHNDIWLRIGDASTSLANITGVRLRFGGDGSISITRFLSGSPSTLVSKPKGSITPPGPGAVLVGEAGAVAGGGTLRYFRGVTGVSTRIEVTEAGTGSGAGSTYRRWGHGGRAEGHLLPLPGQEKPASLHYWTGMDQTI